MAWRVLRAVVLVTFLPGWASARRATTCLAYAKSRELIGNMIGDVKRVMHGVVNLMPTHEPFLAGYCAAPAI